MSHEEEEACDLYHAHLQQQLHSADDQERAVITHLPEISLTIKTKYKTNC